MLGSTAHRGVDDKALVRPRHYETGRRVAVRLLEQLLGVAQAAEPGSWEEAGEFLADADQVAHSRGPAETHDVPSWAQSRGRVLQEEGRGGGWTQSWALEKARKAVKGKTRDGKDGKTSRLTVKMVESNTGTQGTGGNKGTGMNEGGIGGVTTSAWALGCCIGGGGVGRSSLPLSVEARRYTESSWSWKGIPKDKEKYAID